MMSKWVVLAVVVVTLLCAPFLAERADALAFPQPLWEPEWVGILCLRVVTSPGSPPSNVLLQVHFDQFAQGIFPALADADRLFAIIGATLIKFGPLAGSNAPQIFCSLKPSEIQAIPLNAYQVAVQLAPQFTQLGFALYRVLDLYGWAAPYPVAGAPVLRGDLYIIQGADDATYVGSADLAQSFVP